LKALYFGVPIPGDYYHSTELAVKLESVDKASSLLIDLIAYFGKR
jgi:hypothetical protein